VPPVYSWVEPGWYGIVDELCADISVLLANEPDVALDVLQVKEKLGGLRFYFRLRRVSGANPDASPLDESDAGSESESDKAGLTELRDRIAACVARAEDLASRTCAVCGARGTTRQGTEGIATLCDVHTPASLSATASPGP
jgi:hypothetical protein